MSKTILLAASFVSFFLGIAVGFNLDSIKRHHPATAASPSARLPGATVRLADAVDTPARPRSKPVRLAPPAAARKTDPVSRAEVALLRQFDPVIAADGFRLPVGDGRMLTPCRDGDGFYIARDYQTDALCGGGYDALGAYHLGEDWNGEAGGNSDLGTPIRSIADGRVILAVRGAGCWGPVVVIEHTAPPEQPFRLAEGAAARVVRSLYAHFSEVKVAAGDRVTKGQLIGRMGKDCCNCMAHLHFEILLDQKASLPGPGYYNAADCAGPTCGRTRPSEFIRRNARG